jgi:hypothetical protein
MASTLSSAFSAPSGVSNLKAVKVAIVFSLSY